MKNKIKIISLIVISALFLSFLVIAIVNGWFGDAGGKDVTLISREVPMAYSFLYAPNDENAQEAAALFKSRLLDCNLPAGAAIYPSDIISEPNEILFGNTDREVSRKAQKLLDRKSKSSPDDYHWVLYYKGGKLAIVANCPLAYELAVEKLFEFYENDTSIVIKDTLKEHFVMTELSYKNHLAELERIAAEKKKAENAVLLEPLLPLLESQRTELSECKGTWNKHEEISESNPEIYLFKDYTKNIGTSVWGSAPADPIDEHPRLLITSDRLPLIREKLKEETPTNEYFLSLVDKILPNGGVLPDSSYQGENATVNNSNYHNYDETYLSTIQVKALSYLIYEDEYYGYQAIYYMKNFLKSLDIKQIASDQTRVFGYVMYTAAIVYDWCYDLLTETDKIQFIAGVENCICRGYNVIGRRMEVGFPPSRQGSINGHGAEYQILRDYLSFAVAIYGDNDSWWDYIGARVCNDFAVANSYYFQCGISQQGTGYATIRVTSNLFSAWIVKAATGVNPYEGLENVIRGILGYECKPGYIFTDSDNSNNYDYKKTSFFSDCAYITAYIYGDAAMLAQAEHLTGNIRYLDGYSGMSATAYVALRGFCELDPAEDRYEGMPLIQYNGYPLGQYIVHEAWNDADAASAVLRIKEISNGNHEHADSGTFEIYYKGMLTSDGGAYNNSGADHTRYFHQSTIAHNGLIIYNPALANTDIGFYSGGQKRIVNTSAGNTLESWLANKELYTGKVTGRQHAYKDADETQPLYAYIAGDITGAYHTQTVSYVGRRMLSVFTGDETYPMVFFVYDDITSLDAMFEKRFLLQISSPDAPTVDNASRTIITENEGGRLVLTCLSDKVDFRAIGGRAYDSDGKYDCANSMNYCVNGKQIVPMNGTADDGHWGRVELVWNDNTADASFMNLLYVTDKGNAKMATVSKITAENGLAGGTFDEKIVGLFATSRERANTEISCKTFGSASMSYYVSGVAEGAWTVTVDGKVIGTYTATEEGGLLTFTAPAGNLVLTPKN